MSRERFYAERDQRAAEYGLPGAPFGRPAAVVISREAAATIGGQLAAIGLINMAARLHRTLRVQVPDVPLLVPALSGGSTLPEAVDRLVRAIDPYNDLVIAVPPDSIETTEITVAVGGVPGTRLSIGADRWVGRLSDHEAAFTNDASTVLGASLAACLGAAALAHLALGEVPGARRVSLWDFDEGQGANPGPGDAPGPLDVGAVAVIGAGAVASGLAYWLRQLGLTGNWTFVDRDMVELHNTGRSLGLLAHHAGWIAGEPGFPAAAKAVVTAELLGARYFVGWYDDWVDATPGEHPDLVLPLANGPGLRSAIGQRGEAILIHATTSRSWTADLHRHFPQRDGCIACRLPEATLPALSCSTSPLPGASVGNDASLPFLSGSAGLLLLAGLIHLAGDRLAGFQANHWQLHLDLSPIRTTSSHQWPCEAGCSVARHLPLELRRALPRGRRWAHLD